LQLHGSPTGASTTLSTT